MNIPYFSKSRLGLGLTLIGLVASPAALAEPVSLDDSWLHQVTAGNHSPPSSGSGGAIIGNSSEATISQSGGVELDGEAQSGASGLNLVNSAESTVANGVNVWDASTNAADAGNGEMLVDQSNIINQEQRRSASMPNYSRPEANTFVEVVRSGSEDHNLQLDRNNDVIDLTEATNNSTSTSTASVDTTIKADAAIGGDTLPRGGVDTNTGKGGAGAGTLDLDIDGGEMQLGIAVGGDSGGGIVTANPDQFFTDSSGAHEVYGGMDVGNEDSDFSLYGRLILPEITIEVTGAGCGVAMGSCDASGSTTESRTDLVDQSVMDNEVSSSVGDSQYTENVNEQYRSPFELNNAQAEYIVVDDSILTVNTAFNLKLAGSAQSSARGMNIVNATGSAVADGVNVAKTGGLGGGAMSLSQANVISHSR